ncbi:MAG TPA: hypothetical protein VL588_11505 [Bdellovibrionota bacterium]|nr:hypothetical protein [Bdellovibrionota bacterium]
MLLFLGIFAATAAAPAYAGVFDLPHFVMPGGIRLGVEPELTLTSGSGIGVNFKGTYGLNDLINLQAVLGAGTGPQRFRFGGAVTLDFFPDLEKQPGVGLAGWLIRYDTPAGGLLDFRAAPYIHKSFKSGTNSFEPFLAIPLGFGVESGQTRGLAQIGLGCIFHSSESLNWTVEMEVPITGTETQLSGGVSFYF